MDTISRSANYLLCMKKWTLLNKPLKKHYSLNNALCMFRAAVPYPYFLKGTPVIKCCTLQETD